MNTHQRSRITGAIDQAALGDYIPTNYANCELWLAADKITANDGDALATWADQSGNSRDFTQGTAARKPAYKTNIINGKPVVRFVDDWMQNTGMVIGSSTTFIIVIKPTTTTPQGMFDTAPNAGGTFRNYSAGNIEWHNGAPSFALSLANTNAVLLVFATELVPTRKVLYYKNGTLISTNTSVDKTYMVWTNPGIGCINITDSLPYVGDMAEFIVYSRILTSTELKNASDYLIAKYAIA